MSQVLASARLWETITAAASDAAVFAVDIVRDGLAHAPALMLGLAALLVLPLISVLSIVLRPFLAPRPAGTPPEPRRRAPPEGCSWPASAFLEIEGRARCPIRAEMVRIGREDDNDIRLAHASVHRYHALIHRTEDAEFFVRDLSTADGRGVVVNGRRTRAARLRDGDMLRLGEAELKFIAQPA